MDININYRKERLPVKTEKLYTQEELDNRIRASKQDSSLNKKIEDKETLEGLVRKSNRILISISTHKFPFDPFPDTINIEEGRITVITRRFFAASLVHSVDIKDISNIFINMAPFFAQLVIISKTFEENEIRIKNLKKREAIFVRRIVEGLRLMVNKQIDTSNYTKEGLVAKLKELSTTEIVT